MGSSIVINTLNEEANIADCIRSVQGLADEVVVCDMHSDNRTAADDFKATMRIVFDDDLLQWNYRAIPLSSNAIPSPIKQ